MPSNQGVSATAVVGSEKGGEEFAELESSENFEVVFISICNMIDISKLNFWDFFETQ